MKVFAFALCLVGAGNLAADAGIPATAPSSAAPEAGPATAPAGPDAGAASPSASGAAEKPAGPQMSSVQSDALIVEISTAGFYELAARARELGLPDSGSAEELRASLYKYYGLEAPAAPTKGRVVTIQRARQATYAKLEEEEGGIVRASGGVILTLVDTNGDTQKVEADSIAFDRDRSSLTARGKVRYERKAGTTTDVFVGEALSANLDDWSGVFIDGKMRKAAGAAQGGATAGDRGLVIAADTIISRSTDIMVLQNGVISSCDADDPHYAIRARRVWILGDKEIALSSAVFSLGNVPILWLPFFYYPGDDIIFHPVIGYRTREGNLVQTTTYLIGQKAPATQTTSLLSMTQGGPVQPTVVKGLFLRKVAGPPPKDQGSLKAILDLYSNLGGFAGVQGSFPNLSFLDKTDLFAGVGLSRSLFNEANGTFSPYDANAPVPWQSVWNGSDFLTFQFPLRYAFDFSTSMRLGPLSANLALPLYSDPFIAPDFRNRSEDMDWFKLLSASTDTSTPPGAIATLVPKLDLALSLKPKGLDPYLQSMEITHLGTSMTILTKPDSTLTGGDASVDPRRQFFYPSLFRPIDATATFGGSFFSNAAKATTAQKGAEGAAPLELRNPWDSGDETKGDAKASDAAASDTAAAPAAAAPAAPVVGFRLPLSVQDVAASLSPAWTGTATWSLAPSVYYEDRYRSDWIDNSGNAQQWTDPSQIDFSSFLYSLLSYKVTSSVDMNAAYGDYLSSTLSLSYAGQDQQRLIDTADDTTKASYDLADNLYRSQRVGESARLTLKPLAGSWLWNATTIGYGIDSTIFGYKYDTTLTNPAFTPKWLAWDPTSITAHNVSVNLALRPGSLPQSLSIVASLPPTLESYSAQLNLSAGFATFHVQSRMFRKAAGADFSFDPIGAGLTIGTAPGPALTDNAVYDQTGVGWVSNVSALSWGPFSTTLILKQTNLYKFQSGAGWQTTTDPQSFQPTDLAASLTPVLKYPADASLQATSGTQWSFSPSLALSQSLVRFTESTLAFGLNASLKINNQLTLSLAISSQNAAAWRYYPGLFSQLPQLGVPALSKPLNPFLDIWDSLSVWDNAALTRAQFKLKNLSFTIARDLHDWTLSATASTSPLYDFNAKTYTLDTKLSILLAWKDLAEVKSTVTYDSQTTLTQHLTY